ncbi:multicopper oxidase family protein [Nocardioides plantarum]|uniref:Multicopper oxidase CueO n=1 Tax=Nocardioides plantarum TaxID=29299 RepID=A0ABV5K4H1_9ACTN|nr:multicopper oxidase domain-containing protein [Nocardioides plantarum]
MSSKVREVVSRRRALQSGAALVGVAATPVVLSRIGGAGPANAAGPHDHAAMTAMTADAGSHDHAAMTADAVGPPHPAVAAAAAAKFTRALPILGTQKPLARTSTTDVYASRIVDTTAEILPGVRSTVRTYDGSFSGTVVRATRGRRVLMVQTNKTSDPSSVHLHGGVTPQRWDGGGMAVIAPGKSKEYVYANTQPGATLWQHDHVHHAHAENVFRGLARPYLLHDPAQDALNLPSGEYDVPLVLRDARFDSDGQLAYVMDDAEGRSTILVNGVPWPVMKVKARRYRLRFINAANLRFFVMALSTGTPFTQIGGDGGLLPAPWQAPVIAISPGERAEVVVDFSAYPKGTVLTLDNYIGPGPMEDVGKVMAFEVGDPAPDTSTVPASLAPLPALKPAAVRRRFELAMDEPGSGGMAATINGLAFDHDRIDTTVPWGSTEEWTVVNTNATLPHNFHTHLVPFRVLSRDGKPVGLDESGLKDTVQIFPGQTVVLRLTFDSHRGVYPYHCHMLDHSDMGMMAQMKVV